MVKISNLGKVIGGFKSEQANINAFKHAWPEAKMIFVDTVHSKTQEAPEDGIFWVRDFDYSLENVILPQ